VRKNPPLGYLPGAQEDTGFRSSEFVSPPNIRSLSPRQEVAESAEEFGQQLPLVISSAGVHKDKIARVRDKKVGLSFQKESTGIRKRPVRLTQ
jgi:hypothetical protein